MTARNIQNEVKKKGLPWSTVKGFDTFTPVGFADRPAYMCTHTHTPFLQAVHPEV
jgi:acylpyruvate hydrolase